MRGDVVAGTVVASDDIAVATDANQNYPPPVKQRNLDDFTHLSSECFWEMDAAFRYSYVSGQFSQITGIPRTIALGMNNSELGLNLPDQSAEEYRQILDARGDFRDTVFLYTHPDGRELLVSANGEPIFDGSGQFSGYRGTAKRLETSAGLPELNLETRTFYQLAGRVANLGLWEWDEVANRCVFCSEELAKLHGLTVDEYLARTATLKGDCELVHPEDRAEYAEAWKNFLRNPRQVEQEFRLLAGGDKVRNVRELLEPVFDQNRKHTRTIGFLQDISAGHQAAARLEQSRNELERRVKRRTEQLQQMNDKLRESETRLRDATRIAKLGYFKWDAIQDRAIYVDEEYAEIVGVSAAKNCESESLDTFLARLHCDDVDMVMASYRRSKREKAPIDIEYRIVHPNGDIRYVHERSTPKVDGNGVVIQTFGTMQDITERKLASEESLLFEERLHELGAKAREVLYVLTADWQQIIYVNAAFEHIWGHSCEAVVENPKLWIDALHSDDRDMILAEIHEKSGSSAWNPRFSDCRVIGANGKVHWLSTRVYPVLNRNAEIVRLVGVVEDITERKEATDALHQVQKMDAVGQLTGGVAHDFNNLLTVILGNARLLEGRVSADDELLLRDVIAAGDRGAELTKRLLAFSRLQPLQSKATDIVKLVFDIGGLLRRTLGHTIAVDISSTCTDAIAFVDPGLLENALLNLSINARDAMPGGGRLKIRVDGTDTAASNTSRTLEIVVEDDGVGMTKDVLSRSLEPFFTTKAPGEGSGLGLSMVYGFVKQSKGDLLVDSRPDEGTSVTIRLPRVDGNHELPE